MAELDFDLNLDLGDMDLDFDLADFDLDDVEMDPVDGDDRTRILKPTLDKEIITKPTHFKYAKDFASHVDLASGSRTFAWCSGSFIFGDLPEALWRERGVGIRELYISTLSVSDENVDSWAGLLSTGMIERFDLLLSGYFYSHEKYSMIPYIYEKLDTDQNVFQVAFGSYHCKLICIKTYTGHTIVMHGSANARSSKNVEHVMIEIDNQELYDFNATQIHEIVDRYKTINHKARPQTRTQLREYFDKMRRDEDGKREQREQGTIRETDGGKPKEL